MTYYERHANDKSLKGPRTKVSVKGQSMKKKINKKGK